MGIRRKCECCGSEWDLAVCFCPHDGQPLAPIELGRYVLQKAVAHIGMSDVFEAVDSVTNQRVAIKLISAERAAHDDTAERLRREGRAASAMGDPNIVEIGEFGSTEEGDVYMVMEWLDGETLREFLDRGPVPPGRALDMAAQIASGLASAHSIGVVHRDVKPENVMVVPGIDGAPLVKILDFGVAKVSEAELEKLTQTGAMIGTPAYISPEQAQGLPVDARSDVYSLGCVLYELFTGVPPFHSSSLMEVVIMHVSADPPKPSIRAPDRAIAPVVDDLIMRCLAKSPADRVPSMLSLRRQLMAQAQGSLALPTSSAGSDADLDAARTLHYRTDELEAVMPPKSESLEVPSQRSGFAIPRDVTPREPTVSVLPIVEALLAPQRRLAWPIASGVFAIAIAALGIALALQRL